MFLLLIGIWIFALMRPEYSHISQTISELGEDGAPLSGLVSVGLFLSVGQGKPAKDASEFKKMLKV